MEDALPHRDVQQAHRLAHGRFGLGRAAGHGAAGLADGRASGAAHAHIAGIALCRLSVGLLSRQKENSCFFEIGPRWYQTPLELSLPQRLTPGQSRHNKTDEKSNEITAIPQLLELLELRGCVVTIDAMGCPRESAQQITQGGADYALAVKQNQGQLQLPEGIRDLFEGAEALGFDGAPYDYIQTTDKQTTDKGHGRVERRECWVITLKKGRTLKVGLQGKRRNAGWDVIKVLLGYDAIALGSCAPAGLGNGLPAFRLLV